MTSSIFCVTHFERLEARVLQGTKKGSEFDFIADEFRQTHVVRLQALEEKQERIVPAPFQFVADSADLLQVAVRVGDENPCAFSQSVFTFAHCPLVPGYPEKPTGQFNFSVFLFLQVCKLMIR